MINDLRKLEFDFSTFCKKVNTWELSSQVIERKMNSYVMNASFVQTFIEVEAL